jgi:hypothetical protein
MKKLHLMAMIQPHIALFLNAAKKAFARSQEIIGRWNNNQELFEKIMR